MQFNGAAAAEVLKDIEIEVRRLIIEYQRRTLTPPPSNEASTAAVAIVPVEGPSETETVSPAVALPRKKRMSDILGTTVDDSEQADVSSVSETTPCRRTEETVDSPAPLAQPGRAVEAPRPQPMSAAQQLRSRVLALREARAERKWMKRYYKSLAFQVRCNVEPLEDLLDFIHDRLE